MGGALYYIVHLGPKTTRCSLLNGEPGRFTLTYGIYMVTKVPIAVMHPYIHTWRVQEGWGLRQPPGPGCLDGLDKDLKHLT